MKKIEVYLVFPGNCEEAMNFYKDCFGGEIQAIERWADSKTDIPEDYKNKVLHGRFKSDDIFFMACDTFPNSPVTVGSNISLSLDFSDENEQQLIFDKLAAGGKITMPLQDTFWNAHFGMLTDKFGINWMLNCNKK